MNSKGDFKGKVAGKVSRISLKLEFSFYKMEQIPSPWLAVLTMLLFAQYYPSTWTF